MWSTVGGLPLLLDDGVRRYVYGPSLTPIAQVDGSGDVEYLHGDLLGSVRTVTDGTGAVAGTADFDAFGNVVARAGAGSAFGFTGNWTDEATGLVHLRARDYDPATGQFLTVDPAVDSTRQPYAYTGNSPLLLTDPSGLDPWGDILEAGGLGLAAGLGAGSVPLYMQNRAAGNSIYDSLVMAYNPVYGRLAAFDAYKLQGDSDWDAFVKTFNPFYSVLNGIDSAITDGRNGCSWEVIAEDLLEAGYGLLGTFGIAFGGAAASNGLRSAKPTPVWGQSAHSAPAPQFGTHWANPSTLDDHFLRHGRDFNASSADDYSSMASDFFERAAAERLPTKIDSDGVIRIYDGTTNTFGSYAPNGGAKTFFKPSSGSSYWGNQPGVLQ